MEFTDEARFGGPEPQSDAAQITTVLARDGGSPEAEHTASVAAGYFDPATRKLKLSHIFDWYKDDFGKQPAKVIDWINHYRTAKLPTDAQIEYVDYDWTLNDQHLLKR